MPKLTNSDSTKAPPPSPLPPQTSPDTMEQLQEQLQQLLIRLKHIETFDAFPLDHCAVETEVETDDKDGLTFQRVPPRGPPGQSLLTENMNLQHSHTSISPPHEIRRRMLEKEFTNKIRESLLKDRWQRKQGGSRTRCPEQKPGAYTGVLGSWKQ
ncbi:hypothetical protein ACJ72_06568 [Emergomyces africanus]|uniref:Uncharacterized protein n=1 Tax=Emergomyces africanus TaxID=1955775 RepID=A0A1B7NQP6_9EURO|nr:hypothetical protein ACJ72_06568 [Emergomyces africanus]